MTILLLGGGGFIGKALWKPLFDAGHSFRVLSRRAEPELFPRDPLKATWQSGDIADPEALASAMQGVEIVVHLAGPASPARSQNDWTSDVQAQVLNSIAVLECMRANNVRRLVFLSSGGTVYGRCQAFPIDEDQATNPISTHGINKLAAEKHVGLCRHLGWLDPVVLRVANAYGPGQPLKREQGIIGTVIDAAISGQAVRIWGDGSAVRDFIYVDDVAGAILAAIERPGVLGTFNIGSGEGRSIRQVIAELESILGKAVQVEYLPGRPLDVPYNVLDTARARRELEWTPGTGFREGLSATVAAW